MSMLAAKMLLSNFSCTQSEFHSIQPALSRSSYLSPLQAEQDLKILEEMYQVWMENMLFYSFYH